MSRAVEPGDHPRLFEEANALATAIKMPVLEQHAQGQIAGLSTHWKEASEIISITWPNGARIEIVVTQVRLPDDRT